MNKLTHKKFQEKYKLRKRIPFLFYFTLYISIHRRSIEPENSLISLQLPIYSFSSNREIFIFLMRISKIFAPKIRHASTKVNDERQGRIKSIKLGLALRLIFRHGNSKKINKMIKVSYYISTFGCLKIDLTVTIKYDPNLIRINHLIQILSRYLLFFFLPSTCSDLFPFSFF